MNEEKSDVFCLLEQNRVHIYIHTKQTCVRYHNGCRNVKRETQFNASLSMQMFQLYLIPLDGSMCRVKLEK